MRYRIVRVTAFLVTGFLVLLLCFAPSLALGETSQRPLLKVPLSFTENRGQWPQDIYFRSGYGSATVWFSQVATHFELSSAGLSGKFPALSPAEQSIARSTRTVITVSNVGCRTVIPYGHGPMDYLCHYLIGNDPLLWRTAVPNFTSIEYTDLYSGIDLRYYESEGRLEYDYIVHPGADYREIQLKVEGADSLLKDSKGNLAMSVGTGNVFLHRPIVYQEDDDICKIIDGDFVISSSDQITFALGTNIDPSLPLVIDPVVNYSTYLGGSASDVATAIAVDASGNTYVTGTTTSTDFPLQGAYQSTQSSGDAFVTKLSASGNSLIYSTYLGGTDGGENGNGIAVDAAGCAYIVGATSSTNFPTLNPVQTVQGAGDAFVTKLSADGSALVYSTYLGGQVLATIPGPIDVATAVTVDDSGAAYVVGYTFSQDFPVSNQFQSYQGPAGSRDAFLTKFSPSGTAHVFSTYLGGNAVDRANAVAVDSAGHAFVAGSSTSTNFPLASQFQNRQGPTGLTDAFVTKFASAGNSVLYSTYLGGSSSEDEAFGVAIDKTGSAYIVGSTNSNNFPLQIPIQLFQGPGTLGDAFVTKLSAGGNTALYSTYLGGNNSADFGGAIAVDTLGSAIVVGTTMSDNFPTVGPYQTYQGATDAFVTRIAPGGGSFLYSTYLGGSTNEDVASGVALDISGSAYVTGTTSSSNFPMVNPYQSYSAGLTAPNAFITKLSSVPEACCFPSGTCTLVDPGACIVMGGTPGGPGSNCTNTYCPKPPEACCFPDGSCQNMEPLICTQSGGLPGGPGTVCSTTYCPKPVEACCFPNGTCQDLEPLACAQQGGTPQGGGTNCATSYCIKPPEACCFPNGSCQNKEPLDCSNLGGVPQGTGTTCATSYCPRPPQACCLPDGSCQFMEPRDCQLAGGVNRGPGSTCASVTCPQPSACCFTDGSCQNLLSAQCTTQGGHSEPSPIVCASQPCCCRGLTGNVDCDPTDGVDISDLSTLIDNLYISFTPLCCAKEANTDGQTGVDISDLSALIDYLYISFTPTAACQ